MPALIYSSREELEVHRFTLPVAVGIPLLAIFFQAFVPVRLSVFHIFDVPLIIVLFFAVARRNPLMGLLTGSVVGLIQDSLTQHQIGIYGISKTVIGYLASSMGVKLDVENPGSRILITFAFSLLHNLIYFAIAKKMVGLMVEWRWGHEFGSAVANALLAVALFAILDRTKHRSL